MIKSLYAIIENERNLIRFTLYHRHKIIQKLSIIAEIDDLEI